MGWKIFDYHCEKCGADFESMEKYWDDEVLCPGTLREGLQGVPTEVCGAVATLLPSANLGWSNDKETKSNMLRKRSQEHTRKEQRNGNMLSPRDLPKL